MLLLPFIFIFSQSNLIHCDYALKQISVKQIPVSVSVQIPIWTLVLVHTNYFTQTKKKNGANEFVWCFLNTLLIIQ